MDLSIRGLVKRFGALTALDDVSLDVPQGTFVCFLGPSGCGKTTLLRVIAGLEAADEGRLRLGECDLSEVPARKRNFGVVFQSYSLFPNMTAARNVAYGLECRGWARAAIAARVADLLEIVSLTAHGAKFPAQLSGGQQQRVALARALAPDPSLLLLDEPLSALDAKVREDLRGEIRAVQRRLGITTIMVTHDQEEALTMADLVVVMRDGRIEQIGPPAELYDAPRTAFVADFIGRMNMLDVEPGQEGAVIFAGTPLRLETGTPAARVLGIRPESIMLGVGDACAPNSLSGTVREVQYLGNLARITVTPGGAPRTSLLVELHGNIAAPVIGARVVVTLPPAALRVLA